MHTPRIVIAVLAGLLAVATACSIQGPGADPTAGASPQRPVPSEPAGEPAPSEDEPLTGEVPAEILERIVEDAAERADADIGDVEIMTAEAVTWSDGSLDCPEPGMMYTQALVDGYHVILDAAGTELDYRVTTDGTFRLCESPAAGG